LEDFKNRWKQIGLGGGSVLLVMALFQERGIEFLDRTRDSELKAVYVRTDAIELRVEKIEQQLLAFNEKFDNKLSRVDNNMLALRTDMGRQLDKIVEMIRDERGQVWSRQEHDTYSYQLDQRLRRLEDDMRTLREYKTKGED
jgi:hypothetical protein